jgi:dehydrogenase/reductase SDR family protein 7
MHSLPHALRISSCLPIKYFVFTDSLAGKVVWITGASSGIGENIAHALARAGVKLVLSARREHELERVKKNCLGGLVSYFMQHSLEK